MLAAAKILQNDRTILFIFIGDGDKHSDIKSFIQENESFILTLIGILGGGLGVLLSYFLKSRCTRIKLGCIRCEREPLSVIEIPENV